MNLLASTLLLATVAQAQPVQSFALLVGNNAPHEQGAATLRYADDDALRMYELFQSLDGRVRLHAEPDAETGRRMKARGIEARPVSEAALRESLRELAAEIEGARRAGWATAFYFFFAGHGDRRYFEPLGRSASFIQLDTAFTGDALYQLLDQQRADRTHVLLDACHALELVAGRGELRPDEPESDLRAVAGDFFDRRALSARPDLGIIVSTTPEATALESHRLEAGILTYVVRSGMLGAADLDGDLVVTYGELEAFARVATFPEGDGPRIVQFHAEPPQGRRDAAIVDLNRGGGAMLRVPPEQQTRYDLVDEDGVAYAGFYGTPNVGTQIMLLADRAYTLARFDAAASAVIGELDIPSERLRPRRRLTLSKPMWRKPQQGEVARGVSQVRLFRQPFGPFAKAQALRGKTALVREKKAAEVNAPTIEAVDMPAPQSVAAWEELSHPPEPPDPYSGWRYGSFAAAGLGAAGGAITLWLSREASADAGRCASIRCREDASRRRDVFSAVSAALFASAGVFAGTGVTLYLIADP